MTPHLLHKAFIY